MAKKLYPIGIQTFELIRKDNNAYVDKTEYVYDITHTNGKYFFLSRPRRFGKSLLLSTMKSYFEGRKDLFKGLAIEGLEKEWAEYPVMLLSMASAKHLDAESLQRYLLFLLKDNEERFEIECDTVEPNLRLANLIKSVCQKTGRPVVVLIDEYDAPLLDVAHDESRLSDLRNVMRNFYRPLKDCDPYLRFVFLTGITKFSQMSIFSELNNIVNISMQERYAGICGITKDELLTQMSDDIDSLANQLAITREETIDQLTSNYDGYHFTWPSPDVFNPYSLLSCFSEGKFGAYWFGTGTPTYLIEKMRQFGTLPSAMDRFYAPSSSFDAPTETMTDITPLLYQSGYVTIKGYDEDIDLYTLEIPNKEIRVGLYKSLLPNYLNTGQTQSLVTIAHMAGMIKQGDMDAALRLLQTFLETVPYCDNTKYEGHWQQLMYIVFALLTHYRITVEQRTAKGRTDITLETADHIYIMELKFGSSADEALAQIKDNRYAEAFAMRGKKIVKVGICFDVNAERNITKWIIE